MVIQMIDKKDLELKLLLRESHIQQLNLRVEELEQKLKNCHEFYLGQLKEKQQKIDNLSNAVSTLLHRNDELKERINKAKENIEYCYVKGRTKNNKPYDLGLYEILTDKSLFFLTRKEVEQYFSKELRKK